VTIKGDGSEGISKKFLDWITGVSAIATILTTIFGLFGDNKKAQLWAFVAAIILALISSGIYLYQRRRAAKLKIAELQEPLSASAALRGLLPFEEGDELPGRGRDVQDIFTLVSSSTFRFGVLWGESGCGKTSLLRAGLIPKLRNEKYLPLYIHKPTNDPQEAIRLALVKELGESTKKSDKDLKTLLKAETPKGKKIIILFDQFEEFFLTNRTPSSRAGFIKWMGSVVNDEKLPITFLIGIRADFFAQLQNFSPPIPEPTSTRSTYQLQNFDTEQAKQIFSAAAKADGIQFEPELIQAVIKELEAEDFIRPAELQVVGTRLKRKNITRLNQYEILGGARRILSSYISDEIKQSANEQAARLVLRLMCADAVETKSPTDLEFEDILSGVSGSGEASQLQSSVKEDEIQKILNQFVTARVLIRTEENKYNLAHDYLAPYVRTATEGAETNVERANRLLKRYVAQYKEDSSTRIPFGRVRWIQKYASTETKSEKRSRELIRKSTRSFYGIISIPIILIAMLYLFLASAYYFGVDEDKHIVIYSGSPELKILPGFDQIVIQTDFMEEELSDAAARDEIITHQLTGFWFETVDGTYQKWGEQIVTRLTPDSQARALDNLGNSDRSVAILLQTITTKQNSSSMSNFKAEAALGELILAKPEIVTNEIFQNLFKILLDPNKDSKVRQNIDLLVADIATARPEFVTSEMIQVLIDDSMNPSSINSYHVPSYILTRFIQARPDLVNGQMFQKPIDVLSNSNPNDDESLRRGAASVLSSLVRAKPEFVTEQMLQIIFRISSNAQEDSSIRYDLLTTMGLSIKERPELATKEMFQVAINIITTTQDDGNTRNGAINALGYLAQAKPEFVTSEILQTIIEVIINPQSNADVRYYAANALSYLDQAQPESITDAMFQAILRLITDSRNDVDLRSEAAQTLISLAQVKPEFVTDETLQSLVEILTNQQEDAKVRAVAAFVLGKLAETKPEMVTNELIREVIDPLINTEDEFKNFYVRHWGTDALGNFIRVNPKSVTNETLLNILDVLANPQYTEIQRHNVVGAFAQIAQANPKVLPTKTVPTLIALLTNRKDSVGRKIAAQALFAIAFADPSQGKLIRAKLEELSHSPQPDLRIAATEGLKMMTVGQLIEEVRAHPDRTNTIELRLRYINYEPLSFAVDIVRDVIYEMETENK